MNNLRKVINDIIKPKEEVITKLFKENKVLYKELARQTNIVDEAEKYQKERDNIIADNRALHNRVNELEIEYKHKSNDLEYEYKYRKLEKENSKHKNIIDRFYTIVDKFISGVCYKLGLGDSKELIRNFEKENNICIDPQKQIAKEEREKNGIWNCSI